jgi:electron transfer flavoprotein alpha subunit
MVDAGTASKTLLVGQSGCTVNPRLYLAFGISGAPQHLAGIQSSTIVVAVNSDPTAPIFRRADFGCSLDLFAVVDELETIAADA